MKTGHAIFDGTRQYIPRVWNTKREADKELREVIIREKARQKAA